LTQFRDKTPDMTQTEKQTDRQTGRQRARDIETEAEIACAEGPGSVDIEG